LKKKPKQTRNKPEELPPSLAKQKKVESKSKKQKNKSILEKKMKEKKNVSKELRTYLTLEATINYVNYVYLELSLNV